MEDDPRSVYTVDASDQRIFDKVEAVIRKFFASFSIGIGCVRGYIFDVSHKM
jgi:hypothetical protein